MSKDVMNMDINNEDESVLATEASVATLLKLAGQRDMPTDAAMLRARDAMHAAWQQSMQRRKAQRRGFYLQLGASLAAMVLVGVAMLWRYLPMGTSSIVAQVMVVEGDVSMQTGKSLTKVTTDTNAIPALTHLMTDTGRIAFNLQKNLSLRLNQHTHIVFVDTTHVRLLSGEIYVDSGNAGELHNPETKLVIDTPMGEVMHRGTQYRVSVNDDSTLIAVREGSVQVAGIDNHEPLVIGRNEELRAMGEHAERRTDVDGSGAEWDWTAHLASRFDVENGSLAEYLSWFAREHGLVVQYQNAALENITRSAHLHGAVSARADDVNLDELSLITGLSIRRQQNVIHISQN